MHVPETRHSTFMGVHLKEFPFIIYNLSYCILYNRFILATITVLYHQDTHYVFTPGSRIAPIYTQCQVHPYQLLALLPVRKQCMGILVQIYIESLSDGA